MSQPAPHYKFGIDFSSVRDISEDPKSRADYFNDFKSLLKAEREKIKAFHRLLKGGREVVQANTGLVDEIIKHVISSLAALPDYSNTHILENFALTAVGGYGRGELNPCSDVDLIFLLSQKGKGGPVDIFIQDAVSVLWGIKLEIGHSCRTIKECAQWAKDDLTVGTSMIDTRFLIGNQSIYRELGESVRKNVLNKNTAEILNTTLKEKYASYPDGGKVASEPEPDIKNGPGGLRDYHAVLWAVAVRFGYFSLHEINREDIISQDELKILDQAVDFVLRVRNELHYLTGKKTEILSFEHQKALAENLGYHNSETGSAPEIFMRDYFQQATHIHRICGSVFKKCVQAKPIIKKVLQSFQKKDMGHGLYAVKNELMVHDKKQLPFKEDKKLFLHVIRLCMKLQLEPDTSLKTEVRLNANLIDDEFIHKPFVGEFISEILGHNNSERVFRLMHEMDVLGKFLPEFGQSYCLVTYDFYHRFTADEHSLRMIRFLDELADSKEKDLDTLVQVFAEVPSKSIIKLASLLHIPGEEKPSEPSKTQETLNSICHRLGLNSEEGEDLEFLVTNVNTMNEFALHQDINQPVTIREFAQLIGNPKRLNLLYLISYAELKAVAPDTWTASKNLLLSELYNRTRNHLLRPETIHEKPETTREEILDILKTEFDENEIHRHLDAMSEEYLGSVRPEEAAQHFHFSRKLSEKPFVLHHEYRKAGQFYDLILCRQNDSDLFKNFIGVVTAMSLNILGAQVYSRNDGVVFITLQVEGTETMKIMEEKTDIWKEIEKNLDEVFNETRQLSDLLSRRTRFITSAKNHFEAIVPKVQITNTPASAFTFIRVEARDHPGMLYKIAKCLADFTIQIHRAKIACQGGRGIDVFYVTLRENKIQLEPLIQRIKENLISILLVENLEDIG